MSGLPLDHFLMAPDYPNACMSALLGSNSLPENVCTDRSQPTGPLHPRTYLLLFYRPDALAALHAAGVAAAGSPPDDWDTLLALLQAHAAAVAAAAAATTTGSDTNVTTSSGNGANATTTALPRYGLCLTTIAHCGRLGDVLAAIAASVLQPGGTQQGYVFDLAAAPPAVVPLVNGTGWRYAAGLLRQMLQYNAPEDGAAGGGATADNSSSSGAHCRGVHPAFLAGQCLLTLEWDAALPVMAVPPLQAPLGALGVAPLPGSRLVAERAAAADAGGDGGGALVPCNADRCAVSANHDTLYLQRGNATAAVTAAAVDGTESVDTSSSSKAASSAIAEVEAAVVAGRSAPAGVIVNRAPYSAAYGVAVSVNYLGTGYAGSPIADIAALQQAVLRQLNGFRSARQNFTDGVRALLLGASAQPTSVGALNCSSYVGTHWWGALDLDLAAAAAGGGQALDVMALAEAAGIADPAAASAYVSALWHAVHHPNAAPDVASPVLVNWFRYALGHAASLLLPGAASNSSSSANSNSTNMVSSGGAGAGSAGAAVDAAVELLLRLFTAASGAQGQAAVRDAYVVSISAPEWKPAKAAGKRKSALDAGDLAAIVCSSVAGLAIIAAGVQVVRLQRRRRLRHRDLLGRVLAPRVGPDTTLLITDVQNSTALWEGLPVPVMDATVKLHHGVIRRLMAKHDGYESATEGDSFIVAFPDPARAVAFAAACQVALLLEPWPPQLLEHPDAAPLLVAPDDAAVWAVEDMGLPAHGGHSSELMRSAQRRGSQLLGSLRRLSAVFYGRRSSLAMLSSLENHPPPAWSHAFHSSASVAGGDDGEAAAGAAGGDGGGGVSRMADLSGTLEDYLPAPVSAVVVPPSLSPLDTAASLVPPPSICRVLSVAGFPELQPLDTARSGHSVRTSAPRSVGPWLRPGWRGGGAAAAAAGGGGRSLLPAGSPSAGASPTAKPSNRSGPQSRQVSGHQRRDSALWLDKFSEHEADPSVRSGTLALAMMGRPGGPSTGGAAAVLDGSRYARTHRTSAAGRSAAARLASRRGASVHAGTAYRGAGPELSVAGGVTGLHHNQYHQPYQQHPQLHHRLAGDSPSPVHGGMQMTAPLAYCSTAGPADFSAHGGQAAARAQPMAEASIRGGGVGLLAHGSTADASAHGGSAAFQLQQPGHADVSVRGGREAPARHGDASVRGGGRGASGPQQQQEEPPQRERTVRGGSAYFDAHNTSVHDSPAAPTPPQALPNRNVGIPVHGDRPGALNTSEEPVRALAVSRLAAYGRGADTSVRRGGAALVHGLVDAESSVRTGLVGTLAHGITGDVSVRAGRTGPGPLAQCSSGGPDVSVRGGMAKGLTRSAVVDGSVHGGARTLHTGPGSPPLPPASSEESIRSSAIQLVLSGPPGAAAAAAAVAAVQDTVLSSVGAAGDSVLSGRHVRLGGNTWVDALAALFPVLALEEGPPEDEVPDVQWNAKLGAVTMSLPGGRLGLVAYRGLRVRMGLHTGLEDAQHVAFNKVGSAFKYYGPFAEMAKLVSDAAPGGLVTMSGRAFARLRNTMTQRGGPAASRAAREAVVVFAGRHVLAEGPVATRPRAMMAMAVAESTTVVIEADSPPPASPVGAPKARDSLPAGHVAALQRAAHDSTDLHARGLNVAVVDAFGRMSAPSAFLTGHESAQRASLAGAPPQPPPACPGPGPCLDAGAYAAAHSVYVAVPPALVCRLALSPPLRSLRVAELGSLAAPIGAITVAFMKVVGASTLLADLPGPAARALDRFAGLACGLLGAAGGYLVEGGDGLLLAAFGGGVRAVEWALDCVAGLKGLDWEEELLNHELCAEEVVLSAKSGAAPSSRTSHSGADCEPLRRQLTAIQRGLRIKVGLAAGNASHMLTEASGRLSYRGRVMNRAARIAGIAAAGQVLCSGTVWADCEAAPGFAGRVCGASLGQMHLKGISSPIEVVQCYRV